jgi:hypothetical protein
VNQDGPVPGPFQETAVLALMRSPDYCYGFNPHTHRMPKSTSWEAGFSVVHTFDVPMTNIRTTLFKNDGMALQCA